MANLRRNKKQNYINKTICFLLPLVVVCSLTSLFGTLPEKWEQHELQELTHHVQEDPSRNIKKKKCAKIAIGAKLKFPDKKGKVWTEKNWGAITTKQSKTWKELDCVEELGIYDTKLLSYKDTLPQGVYKPILSPSEQTELYEMTKALVSHFESVGILYSLSFGNLLAVIRNNVAVLPWDDDIDFVIHGDGKMRQTLTKGLKKLTGKVYTSAANIGVWELPGGYVMYEKKWGMPWKVHPREKGFPAIDMSTFKIKETKEGGKRYVSNKEQFGNAHLKMFNKLAAWYGTMKSTLTVPFSADVRDPITFHVPDEILKVVADDYGEKSLTECQTSFVHNPLCNRGGEGADTDYCVDSMADHFTKIFFPCTLLPSQYHGMILANEPLYSGA